MRRSILTIALALALGLALSGCSLNSAGGRTETSAASDSEEIAALKSHIVELQRRAAIREVEMGRLEKRLAELERNALRRSNGDAVASRRALPGEEAGPDEAAALPARPGPEAGGLEVSDLPAEPQSAPTIAGTGVEGGNGTAGATRPEAGGDVVLTASAQALYDRGYTLFHQGHFVDSETAFQQFLGRFSTTVLGDNAQFWIAEARHARGDINGALAAYRETATRFPDGNKAPDAQLKIGDCLAELGDTEAARQTYRAVIRDFPSAAAATAARERLAESP